jgi:5-methyltetrahydropteroyltriglutamate--homocysteine methyltransferase
MTPTVAAYQHGIYPRSEEVVAATRGLERGRTAPEDVTQAYRQDLEDFVAVQREAGLDYFSDGMLRWQDIFRPLVQLSAGLDARTLIRWFNNNSFFRAPEVTGDLTVGAPLPRETWEDISAVPEPRAATLPSPYLFSRAAQSDDNRNGLMMELTREILRPVAGALVEHGYHVIHLQEPWLAYVGIDAGDWGDFEKAVTEVREAADGATLVLHTYFGDAGPHIDRLTALPVDAIGVDFVETDLDELGSSWRTGIMAGVLDGRASPVEPIEGTMSFLRRLVDTLDPPSVLLSSNSELEFLPRDLAAQKVRRLGEISTRLKEELS